MRWPAENYAHEAKSYLLREDTGLPEEYNNDLARWLTAVVFVFVPLVFAGFAAWLKAIVR